MVMRLVWFDFAHHKSKFVFRTSKLDTNPHTSSSPSEREGIAVHLSPLTGTLSLSPSKFE
jgi:hypothetical protein